MSSPFVFAGRPLPINVLVTGAQTTDVIDATDKSITVPAFEVNELSNGTATLSVAIYDGTNSIPLGDDSGTAWVGQAMTGRKSYKFTMAYPIPRGSKLRIINGGGNLAIVGTQLPTV